MTYREAIMKSIKPCKDKDGRNNIPFSFWDFSSSLAAIYAEIYDLANQDLRMSDFIQAFSGVDFISHTSLTLVFHPFLSWLLEQELTEEEADVTEESPWSSWIAVADRYNEWVRTEAKNKKGGATM